MFKKLIFTIILSIFIFCCIFFICSNNISAQTSTDAIAIRVIPNSEHLSAKNWYKRQGFTGSPQSVIVDGYNGVRDGRTVYVNVSNVDDSGCIYTNIYLISYNQNAERVTMDIFSQIISHWKFNTNITGLGKCVRKSMSICMLDSDCSRDEYCVSKKAKLIRDTKRLEDFSEIKILLENYKEVHGYYPKLNAGTYLPNNSISVWPSWQERFSQEVGTTIPKDPVNKLGDCGDARFNEITCWDEEAKEFADAIPGDANLDGWPGEEFNGFVSAIDPGGGSIVDWKIELVSPINSNEWVNAYDWNWDAGFNNFSIENTAIINQRKIHATATGLASYQGLYQVKISVTNDKGLTGSKILDVNSYSHEIEISSIAETVVIGLPPNTFSFLGLDSSHNSLTDIYFQSASLNGMPITTEAELNSHGFSLSGMDILKTTTPVQRTGDYEIVVYVQDPTSQNIKKNISANITITNDRPNLFAVGDQEIAIGNPVSINILTSDPNGHNIFYFINIAPSGSNLTINNISGLITGTPDLIVHDYNVDVEVRDEYYDNTILPYEASIGVSFLLSVVNHPPVFGPTAINYQNGVTDSGNFNIDNGEIATILVNAIDPDPGHLVTYALLNNFSGAISINPNTGIISGLENLNFQGLSDMNFNIEVEARDQYCAGSPLNQCSVSTSFDLKVNKYCSSNQASPGFVNSIHTEPSVIYNMGSGINDPGAINDLMSAVALPSPNSCSTISGAVDLTASGIKRDRAIVFVFDTSSSMDGRFLIPPPSSPNQPIDLAKAALIDAINDLYNKAITVPQVNFQVGLIEFNDTAINHGVGNIGSLAIRNDFISKVNGFVINDDRGTQTLSALNMAENMLGGIQADDKIIILLSDGLPTDKVYFCSQGCYNVSCPCCGCPCNPNCTGCGSGSGGSSANLDEKFQDSKFRIAITTQTQCSDTGCGVPPTCDTLQDIATGCTTPYSSSGISDYNCDITLDTTTQATALKNSGVEIYTIYYDTGNNFGESIMRSWASDPKVDYAFAGINVAGLLDQVMANVMSSPTNVLINNSINPGFVNNSNILTQTILSWGGISGIFNCANTGVPLFVSFNNGGSIIFENFKIDYCETLLHP